MFNEDKKAFRLGAVVSLDDLGIVVQEPQVVAEERLHQQLMAEKVMQGLSELPAQQRLIFLLKHREGMTCEEIAEACGISAGTVKKALFRALQRLREGLGLKLGEAENATYATHK